MQKRRSGRRIIRKQAEKKALPSGNVGQLSLFSDNTQNFLGYTPTNCQYRIIDKLGRTDQYANPAALHTI